MAREIIKQGNSFLNAFGNAENLASDTSKHYRQPTTCRLQRSKIRIWGIRSTLFRTNTMAARTVGAIVMGPRDVRGRYNFMSLETGNTIDSRVVARLLPAYYRRSYYSR